MAFVMVTNLKDDLDLEEFVFCAANDRVGLRGSDGAAVLHGEVRRVTGSTHSTSARELRRRPH